MAEPVAIPLVFLTAFFYVSGGCVEVGDFMFPKHFCVKICGCYQRFFFVLCSFFWSGRGFSWCGVCVFFFFYLVCVDEGHIIMCGYSIFFFMLHQ